MAGLTATGLTIKSVDEILADIEADELANIDPDLNVGADDVLGQINGVFAAALGEAWELLEEIYQSAYPDTASGQSLSYVAALTGAIRRPATKAELLVNLIGVVGTIVPAGTRFYPQTPAGDPDPDSLFETTAPATILEQGAVDYVTVTARAVTAGSATTAAAGDGMVITTPVAGLTLITTNGSTPFAEGSEEEKDSELRLRRDQALALAGSSTVEAIRADMLKVTGVDACTVFENATSATDANGLPPKSIEVLVFSSTAPTYTAQDVVDQIWLSKPAGTETVGALSGTATDSQGRPHTIRYSEPTAVRLYVDVELTAKTDGSFVAAAGVQSAIGDWANRTLQVGQSVYASDIINVVADLSGVAFVDVTSTFVEAGDPTPDTTQWVAAPRELGTIAPADVGVTLT